MGKRGKAFEGDREGEGRVGIADSPAGKGRLVGALLSGMLFARLDEWNNLLVKLAGTVALACGIGRVKEREP